jgi:catechol 2,3-dioxygenase-like lactoylglutathione lyase family enzyme
VFDHVTIRVSNREESHRFYALGLRELGRGPSSSGADFDEWNDFSIAQASDEHPVTRGLHVAFGAASRERVDAFWNALTGAGYRDDGAPGRRPQYSEDYYGGFVLDPDGNSAEAVHGVRQLTGENVIDHLWVRVADLGAAKRFYETIAPYAGISLARELPERVHFAGSNRSFGLVHDERPTTQNLHWAFPASDNATVEEFHRVATEAGYRDNGTPGERSVYHAGYYGAYVLDPDGNNVEIVNHNRD